MRKPYQATGRDETLQSEVMKPDTRSFYARAVQAAIEHIAQHLDDALELEALARVACLSPFHFHRVFRGMVGETPLELTRRLRLERAAWRLSDKQRAITEIAFDAGYETHEAFTRAFRASYSASPSGFRLRTYPRIEIAAAVRRSLQRRRCDTRLHSPETQEDSPWKSKSRTCRTFVSEP